MSPQFQRKPYWCGIASVQTALQCLGIKRTQPVLSKLCDVNPTDGTSEEEMKRVLMACDVSVDEMQTGSENFAKSWLQEQVEIYGPAIVCLDEHEHWCVVIGRCADVWVLFDPSNGKENRRSLGIRMYTWEGLKTRWLLPKKYDEGPSWYAIGISL